MIALHAIEQFTTKYGSGPQITAAVDSNEIWIAPTWNPDGYNYVFTVNKEWRKNRRIFPEEIGVDLNRNYPHLWDSGNGLYPGTDVVTDDTYRGPNPGSEAETQTMMDFANDQIFEKLIDFHSRGREVVFGYCEGNSHPFDDWLVEEATKLSIHSGYTGKTRGPSADGENYEWHLARFGTYTFLIETLERESDIAPPYDMALAEANMVFPGILWDIERKIPLSGHVTDKITGLPLEANVELIGENFQTGETYTSGGPFASYHLFLPSREFSIRFSANGYLPAEQNVSITSSTAKVLDIQLSPESTAINNPTALSEDASSPDKIILKGNYPNPFNPKTVITYSIPQSGFIKLKVFNLLGVEVRTLVNQFQHAGTYRCDFDATNLASGIYFYRLDKLVLYTTVYISIDRLYLI